MDTSESSDGCASTTVTSSSSTSGCHKVGYNKSWEKEYPWLVPIAGGSGMLCSLCKKHGTFNKRNRSTTWSKNPCITLRKDAVKRYCQSAMHKDAVIAEETSLAS